MALCRLSTDPCCSHLEASAVRSGHSEMDTVARHLGSFPETVPVKKGRPQKVNCKVLVLPDWLCSYLRSYAL